MKKDILKIWIVLLLACSGCADPLEDKLFDPANAHVRFEFRGLEGDPPRYGEASPDTFAINRRQTDTLGLKVVYSGLPLQQPLQVGYSVQTSSNVQQGVHVSVFETSFAPASGQLQIPAGDFEADLLLAVQDTLASAGYLQLEITSLNQEGISLGMPGPQAQRKTFTLLLE